MTVRDVLALLDTIAPPHLVMKGDPQPRVSPRALLIGDADAPFSGLGVALDVTQTVVEQARAQNVNLLIAHHPLIYQPAATLRADDSHPGPVALACVRHGIAVASAHTNWDVADGGINDVLADLVGMEPAPHRQPLQITYRESLVKIVVFVPHAHRTAVWEAMASAGAGAIGTYDQASFYTSGTGTFRPLPGASPAIGTIGVTDSVEEARLEMIAPTADSARIVSAMKSAHPYEEMAYDVIGLQNTGRVWGIGRIGRLIQPVPVHEFLARVKSVLHFPEVRAARGPDTNKMVETIAVCGGAGAFLLPDARAQNADAFVTSDVRHHEFVDAEQSEFLLIDAGHRETETPGTRELARRLQHALAVNGVAELPITFYATPL